jgi:hypothetical protein
MSMNIKAMIEEIKQFWGSDLEPVATDSSLPQTVQDYFENAGSLHNVDFNKLPTLLKPIHFVAPHEFESVELEGCNYVTFGGKFGKFAIRLDSGTIWYLAQHSDRSRLSPLFVNTNIYTFMYAITKFMKIRVRWEELLKRSLTPYSESEKSHPLQQMKLIAGRPNLEEKITTWLTMEYSDLLLHLFEIDENVKSSKNSWWRDVLTTMIEENGDWPWDEIGLSFTDL